MYSDNKIIGGFKKGEIRIFFVFFEQISVVLGVFRGALWIPNFFLASQCARNCIPAIKLLAISKTNEVNFFYDFRGRFGVVERVPRYWHHCQFFYIQSVCYKLYSGNKIIGGFKHGEIRIFFVFFEQISVVLGVFRGALWILNFFLASQCARNCIPAKKLLAIAKTDEVNFFYYFRGRIWAVERVPRYWHRCQYFYS